jgi:trimethylamine---corrinoid protein Co-methyltransferase
MIKNIPKNIFHYKMDFDVQGIHETAVQILEELGIFLESKKCLDLLKSLGCEVDFKELKAKIPENLIKKSLSYTVPEYNLYDRNGNSSVVYGGNNVLLTSGAAAIRIREVGGNFRNATLNDLEILTRIHDYYKIIDIIHTAADATDINQDSMRVEMAAAVFKNTSKSAWFVASNQEAVEKIYEMALAIRGSKEELVKKPFFRIGAAPYAILGFQKDEIELLMKCAELGIPTGCEHFPIMGLTAPLSISGALAITAANYLAAHVVKTAIDPNNQNIFPVMAGSFNMKNGEIITSSPEIWQYYIAGIKLGQYYEIPTSVLASSDSKDTDVQAIYEKTMGFIISASAGVNNIFAATNDLDAMNLASYEQIVIELEVLSSISSFLKNIPILEPKSDFEMIKSALGKKLFFLEEPYTLSNFKQFIWDTNIFVKDNFQSWKNNGMKKIVEIASEKISKIVKTHEPSQLPQKTLNEIDRILYRYKIQSKNKTKYY